MDKKTLVKFEEIIDRKLTIKEITELDMHLMLYGNCAMDSEGKIINPFDLMIILKNEK